MNQILKYFNGTSISSLANSFKNARNFSNSVTKDLIQNSFLTQDTDLLLNNIKTATSVIHVLELINRHNKIMNINHTVEALKTIFALQKHGSSGVSAANILKHPDFERICKQLKYKAGTLDISQTLEALKVISFLGIPSSSTIYQILLQLIRHNINNMSLRQIMFTDFLLSRGEPCPLIDALKIALPVVYDIQLPIKLDYTNLDSLPEHLHYVSKSNVSDESISLIVKTLMKRNIFDGKTSISIIWSICDMTPKPFLEPLLKNAIRSLLTAGNSISYEDLETSISKLSQRYSVKTPFYYHEKFYNYCANILINKDLGFETAVHLLRKFQKVNHMNNDLLNYISAKCHDNPDLIENGDPLLTYNIICGCAMTDFRPEFYETIKKSFLRIKNFSSFADKDIYLLRLQTALAVLDIYIPKLLEMSLNEDYLKRMFKKNYMVDFDHVLLISQAIKTLRPEYSNYLPSDDFLKFVKSNLRQVREYPIQGVMHHLFGGSNYVKTPASTGLLHHIDHLVVLKKGGCPCPIRSTDVFVEDIQCELPSQIVLIISLKDYQCTINSRQPLGSTNLMLRTLEAKGYSTVPICLAMWKDMPEVEKIPYIVEAIKSKTQLYDQIYDVS